MFKVIGAICVAAGSALISFSSLNREKKNVKAYALLYEFVSYMKRRIEISKTPLSRIISDFSETSEEALKFFGKVSSDNVASALAGLCPEMGSIIIKAFDTIYDSPEGAAGACCELELSCREKFTAVKDEYENKKKSVAILPFAAGAMIIILLI